MTPDEVMTALDAARVRHHPGKVMAYALPAGLAALGHLAIDGDGRPALLLHVPSADGIRTDTSSAGVAVVTLDLSERGKTVTYVALVLLSDRYLRPFAALTAEVLERLETERGRPDLVCHDVLERWRELLASIGAPLSPSRQVGLYGELWQLREIVRVAGPQAQSTWVGPTGARHDFTGHDGLHLEVKTTRGKHGRTVTINGIDQLATSDGVALHLGVLRIDASEAGGESLPELYDDLISLGCEAAGLEAVLAFGGIGTATLAEARIRFSVSEHLVYAVDGEFPRLVRPAPPAQPLHPLVVHVSYDIDLAPQPPHPIPATDVPGLYMRLAGVSV